MKRTVFLAGATIAVCMSLAGVTWAEKIAFLIPERFVSGLDNPPAEADMPLVWEGLEIGDLAGGAPELGLFTLAKRLRDQGHTITFYGTDTDDATVVIADNDLIFISEAIGSSSVVTAGECDYYLSPKPVITTESYLLDNFFLTTASSPFTGGANTNKLKVVDPNHPITKGLPASFFFTVKDEFTGEPAIVTIGTVRDEAILVEGVGRILVRIDGPAPSADTDIQPPDDAIAVMVVDKGEKDIYDTAFPARFVFIGYSDVAPGEEFGGDPTSKTLALLNDTAWQLWDNAFNWALGKEVPVQVEQWEMH